jgi:transcriptional regulator with XRE-family HTH domain
MTGDELAETLAANMRARRAVLRVSQAELARRVGKSQQTICIIEYAGQAVRVQDLPLLAAALETTVPALLGLAS